MRLERPLFGRAIKLFTVFGFRVRVDLSWGLLALTLIFVSVVLWVHRPGTRTLYRDHADILFKYDDKDRADG